MMKARVIPCLLLRDQALVKTVRFDRFQYIGDPINTVRIFNELEVDELIFLDILATKEGRSPNFQVLREISNECFMPLGYGGGIRNLEDAKRIFKIGLEKIVINSFSYEHPEFISQLADNFGAQAIVGSIDVKRNIFGNYELFSHSGTRKQKHKPVDWAVELEKRGVGEILVTSVDKDGTWTGYDIGLIKSITDKVTVPVIACGGAGSVQDIEKAVHEGGAGAAGVGSMVVFQGKGLGVLVNFPDKKDLAKAIDY